LNVIDILYFGEVEQMFLEEEKESIAADLAGYTHRHFDPRTKSSDLIRLFLACEVLGISWRR